ncbi:NAD(P)/FAD-dependent oxidoreductase [Sulfuracidifex tepidarius]|uniref:Sulfide-quinone reductase n=1 Tax=Sulfuracidifex tepidarius TaxID=1294262 RepID=A0A510E6G4_9CREN|nr:FAD-dependent oxidoreductase [Sulfuracidifex tepidarius]BBG25329.1 Sulfide-quinone reductase [Sulfuracidifex tepidarius]BBG28123.1 Sulfide-quinone reductase [Sulfuracidifex tepidarius]
MKVLILGAGYGGLTVAHRLKEYLGEDIEITVVSKSRSIYENTIFPAILTNDVKVEDTVFDGLEVMRRKGNLFVEAEVKDVNLQSKEVKTSKGTFDYDYLVLALGGGYEENFNKISGHEHAFMHHPLSDFLKIKEKLASMDEINAVIGNYTGSPIEGPSYQLALIVRNEINRRGIKGKVTLVTQSPNGVFGMLPVKEISERANRLFEENGIELVKGDSIVEVRKDKVVTRNGKEIGSNFVSILPKLSVPSLLRETSIVNERGYVEVEFPSFRTKRFHDVFAIGDLAEGMIPARTARGAMIAGENVSSTLAKEIKGVEKPLYKQGIICMFHGGEVAGMLRFDVKDKPHVSLLVNPVFSKLKIMYSRMLVATGFNVPYHAAPFF